MVCMKEVIPLKRSSVSLHVLLEKSWVSTTLTVINRSTTLWFVWLKSFRSDIHLWTGKETLAPLTEILLLQCDIRRVALIRFQSICLKILRKKQLISSQISMIPKWNLQYFQLDCQTYFSMEATVLQSVWLLEFHRITSQKLLVQFDYMLIESWKKVLKIRACLQSL